MFGNKCCIDQTQDYNFKMAFSIYKPVTTFCPLFTIKTAIQHYFFRYFRTWLSWPSPGLLWLSSLWFSHGNTGLSKSASRKLPKLWIIFLLERTKPDEKRQSFQLNQRPLKRYNVITRLQSPFLHIFHRIKVSFSRQNVYCVLYADLSAFFQVFLAEQTDL